MKSIFCMMVLMALMILSGAGVAQADWKKDFVSDNDAFGMSVAVEEALNNDITSDEILSFVISNSEQFETKKGLKALYCAGADRDDVREAANKLGITVEDVSVALEESIAECGDKRTLTDRDLIDDNGATGNIGLSDRDIVQPSPEPAPAPAPPAPKPETASNPADSSLPEVFD
ncbi:MAG: hypothetical protein D3908_03025, partial [Candidatus Electrothrix sp. AUS4]|nr:hypothetical protein [Candidatus Electrothrix sp. AUS4]